MATYYLDYEGGNDGNDGTTFANRWKTITSGATAARIAPGDTIRIMGSPAPTSLGISATWTNKSATVTLASALNVLITNCDSAWTASANVTCTANTSIYRTSTGSAKAVIASGFTTGKVAYFDLGSSQNYSAYQGITLWLRVESATLAASTLSIRLCSDTVGDTTVDTLALPAITQTSEWVPVYIDKGSALGNSIRTIALYADLDPGAIDVYLDNISTVKAAGSDALTLQSLIGKNVGSELWWALRQINGTTLTIDIHPNITPSDASRGYSGTTESVTTYKRETIKTDLAQFSFTETARIQDSGSAGSPITFSGGWDRTAMTTQNLETWFDGQSGVGKGLVQPGGYVTIDAINFIRYTTGFTLSGGQPGCVFGTMRTGHCDYGFTQSNTPLVATSVTGYACYTYGVLVFGDQSVFQTIVAVSCGASGSSSGYGFWLDNQSRHVKINTLTTKNNRDGVNGNVAEFRDLQFGTVISSDNSRYGWVIDWREADRFVIDSLTCTDNTTAGLYLGRGERTLIKSYTSSGNGIGIENQSPVDLYGVHTILKSSIAETTKLSFINIGAPTSLGGVSFHNYNGVVGDHRFYQSGGNRATIFSESSVRHTASGLAWKVSPVSSTYVTSDFPVTFSLGKIALSANVSKNITVWVRRTNTAVTAKLVVKGGQLDGISTDQIATAAAAQDTWEQLSVSVTPTQAGVIEAVVEVYGGTTYSVYVDDLGVS